MYNLRLFGAMALVSQAAAEITTIWATATVTADTGIKAQNTSSAAVTSAAASSAQSTIMTTFNAAQVSFSYHGFLHVTRASSISVASS